MPVDYKLRSLRRLFGEASFLRPVKGDPPAPRSGTAATAASSAKATGVPVDVAEASDAAAADNTSSKTRRQRAPGGIPRAFFSNQPPRAMRTKAVGGQLWGIQLYEKQKMKVYYGAMRDKKFHHYVQRARASRFNTDATLMRLLETRLDTVVYRTGFVKTPMQARQWIFHGKVCVNGHKVEVKGEALRPGDVVSIKEGFLQQAYDAQLEAAQTRGRFGMGTSWIAGRTDAAGFLPWLEVDRVGLAAALVRLPTDEEMRALRHASLLPFIRDANMDPHAAMRAYR